MVGRAARMHANDDDAATVDAKWREALHVLHAEPAAYDTALAHDLVQHIAGGGQRDGEADAVGVGPALGEHSGIDADQKIGRAPRRERVCKYVWIAVVAVSCTNTEHHPLLNTAGRSKQRQIHEATP